MGVAHAKATPVRDDSLDIEPPDDWHYVEFDPTPFAFGKFRQAFRGVIYSKIDDPRRSTMAYSWDSGWEPLTADEGKVKYRCVVKTFKKTHAMFAAHWGKDVRLLCECAQLANAFNLEVQPECKLSFATPALFKVTETESGTSPGRAFGSVVVGFAVRGVGLLVAPEVAAPAWIASLAASAVTGYATSVQPDRKQNEFVCIEPDLAPSALHGGFEKLNSNNGWFSSSVDAEVAQAFSHWTWHHTNGQKLICDLQGVRSESGWLLTDPAAHSQNVGGLGPTDGGPAGIESFFFRHECNSMCRGLPKPALKSTVAPIPASQHSTFGWEMVSASSIVHLQKGGTCYANACATVVRAAESRIIGRKIEGHDEIVQSIVSRHGSNGGHVATVLNEECSRRGLRWQNVSKLQAEEAVCKGHALVLSFWITDAEWSAFSVFFMQNPLATLGLAQIPAKSWMQRWSEVGAKEGHAVVITGQCRRTWHIKNSWGDDWAQDGHFQLEKDLVASISHDFKHVFWFEQDLTQEDRAAFSRHRLLNSGKDASQLREAGCNAAELKGIGFDAAKLRDAGFDATQLKAGGFKAMELIEAGFDAMGCKAAGFDAKDLKDAGCDAKSLRAAGFNAMDLMNAGFDAGDFDDDPMDLDDDFDMDQPTLSSDM